MLSLSFIREHPDLVKEGARKKGEPAPVDDILRLDAERREIVTKLEQLKAEQNRRSAAMAKSRDEATVEQLRLLRDEVKALEQRVAPIASRLDALLLEVPNPPDNSVPEGKDATGNVTVRTWGIEGRKPPAFTMRPHYEVAERLGIIDFERAVKVTGSISRSPPARTSASSRPAAPTSASGRRVASRSSSIPSMDPAWPCRARWSRSSRIISRRMAPSEYPRRYAPTWAVSTSSGERRAPRN